MIFEGHGATIPEIDNLGHGGIGMVEMRRDRRHVKEDEYEHWYRVFNNGTCPQDSLPYY